MKDDKRVVKKKLTLKGIEEVVKFLSEEIIKIQEDRLKEAMMSAPVNARAEEEMDDKVSYCYKTLEHDHEKLWCSYRELEKKIEAGTALLVKARDELVIKSNSTLYRIITNGKCYRVEATTNNGVVWVGEDELVHSGHDHSQINPVERSSYKKAAKYIRKQHGEKAIILQREWRAV